jgi:hypothetical protein
MVNWKRSSATLLKIVAVVVLVLVLDKEPSEYDDRNEDEYDPMDLILMIT